MPRVRLTGVLVRQHWLLSALLAAGLALRVVTALAYRPALFYIDTSRYLYDAQGMDPVGYKGPLLVLTRAGGFAAVTVFQHLLGLGMAVIIYVLLRRRGVPLWLAALATAPVLLDAYQLQIEQEIMPDTLFEAMIVAGLAVLVWRPGAGWRRVVAAGLVMGTSATIAQVGEALALPAIVYVLVAAGGGWRRAVGKAAALCGAFALPILIYMTSSYALTGYFYLSHAGPSGLYGRMAAAADCATLRLTPAEKNMCPTPAQQARGQDWLEYANGSPIRPYYNNLPRDETDSLIRDFDDRVLVQQPLRVLRAYAGSAAELFPLTRDGRAGDTPISRWQFQTHLPYFPPWSSRAVVRGEIARFGGTSPAIWRPAAAFLRAYQLGGGYTPGLVMAVCGLAGLAGAAAVARRRADPQTRQQALACLVFFGAGLFVLAVSDVFEFSWRYQLPALVTAVPAGALGITVLIRGFGRPGRPGRGTAPEPARAAVPETVSRPARTPQPGPAAQP